MGGCPRTRRTATPAERSAAYLRAKRDPTPSERIKVALHILYSVARELSRNPSVSVLHSRRTSTSPSESRLHGPYAILPSPTSVVVCMRAPLDTRRSNFVGAGHKQNPSAGYPDVNSNITTIQRAIGRNTLSQKTGTSGRAAKSRHFAPGYRARLREPALTA